MSKISAWVIFIVLTSSFVFQGCINDKSRENHQWTFEVCDGLYAEIFSTFSQGAWVVTEMENG